MIKKIFSLLLSLLILNVTLCPSFAINDEETLHGNSIINAEFSTDLNLNEASKKQIVQFVSTEDYVDKTGFVIPKGTLFTGRIHNIKKSRWAYRRAKARIIINEMQFPNGETYKIKAYTKRRVLKGSALGNIAKGIVTAPVAIVVIVAGSVVMLVETVSIVGLIIVGPTGAVVRGITGGLTKGVNCTKTSGDSIKLKIIKANQVPKMQQKNVQINKIDEQETIDSQLE